VRLTVDDDDDDNNNNNNKGPLNLSFESK